MNDNSDGRLAAALEELEAATRRVEEDRMEDLDRLLALMKRRSAAVQRLAGLLHERNRPPDPAVAERLHRQLERGRAIRERLLLLRASHRAELARLLSGQRAAAAVSPRPRPSIRRIDVHG